MTDIMTRAGAEAAALRTLIADFNASSAQLQGPDVTITIAAELPDRRRFPYFEQKLNVVSLGTGVVIATSEERVAAVEEIIRGRSRDEIFSPSIAAKFIDLLKPDRQYLAGPALANICSRDRFHPASIPKGVEIELLKGSDIATLYENTKFDNALSYRTTPSRPDMIAVVARRENDIVGVAAASDDATEMWQIGIDIVEGERRSGIGRAIVSLLTEAIFDAGVVPYYSTSLPNIGSRKLAHSLGFWPAWVEIYAKDSVVER